MALILCIFFFTLPLAQCSLDSSLAVNGYEITNLQSVAQTLAKNMENVNAIDKNELSTNSNIFIFLLLLIPFSLSVLAFLNTKYLILAISSLLGLIAKIIFIIVINTKYEHFIKPTIFCWIILLIYIGLSGITLYCTLLENKEYKQTCLQTGR